MKASLNNYRQSPRKVRLITELVKGKKADQAQAILDHLIKKGALPIKKLLDSAVANAGVPSSELTIKTATVDKGVVIKRWMPRAMGRAFPIHKHTSKVFIELEASTSKETSSKTKVSAK
ncbi:50S ribosomal protein L22 [Candidatus Gracilibacteria bacterium]|nr:50S ribosomal protein L22 [Candidatus Gracilibacteria bacterium]MCF7898468.1 50S ribosomal protein L22 [Candidatus Paceibacterota bacterium]